VFDKSLNLYRPMLAEPRPEATVVVVEGPLDPLAIAATAAEAGLADQVVPVSGNGTAVRSNSFPLRRGLASVPHDAWRCSG
jgi:hypothetical protein